VCVHRLLRLKSPASRESLYGTICSYLTRTMDMSHDWTVRLGVSSSHTIGHDEL
jgi:hypothetical protein